MPLRTLHRLPTFDTADTAADLSYSGRITKPTPAEIAQRVAQRVAQHRKGSFRGLITEKLIVEPTSSCILLQMYYFAIS